MMDNNDRNKAEREILIQQSESSLHSMSSKKFIMGSILMIAAAYLVFNFCPIQGFNFLKGSLNITNAKSTPSEMYSVVFDAGSTGSRVFVFHFKYEGVSDNLQRREVKLVTEKFMSIEPGISYYAYNPQKAADSLKPLLEKAVLTVPPNHQASTLVLFKATAGLRLLSKTKGEEIMNQVRHFFMESSPFYLPDPEEVEVMGGSDEGLFGWLTVNFLLGSLWDKAPSSTAAAIDLGGGSLQITFQIPSSVSARLMCDERVGEMYILKIINSQFEVHTHSFLGYGLKSAYLQIMGGVEKVQEPSAKIEHRLSTPCFEPGFESTWHHGGIDYTITGQESNTSRLESCQSDITKFVEEAGFKPSPIFLSQELHLFSYFFDIARWAGMVPDSSRHVLLTPADFYASAQQYCQSSKFSKDRPFQCMNLLYIHSFLTSGLQLPSDKILHIEAQLAGREVSWALGSALSSLSQVFSYAKICSGA